MGLITEGLNTNTITHICYGDFHKAYPKMLDIPVDQIDLEFSNSEYSLLKDFEKNPFTKYIGLGIADVHTHEIEDVDEMVEGIRRSLELIPAERMFVDPDCGLKTRTEEEAKAKLSNIKKAVDVARADLQ